MRTNASGASLLGGSFVSAPRVLIGVCGGIAAYKVAVVVRRLREAGVDVVVVPTPASLDFVGVTTWEALSGNPVHVYTPEGAERVVHVATGQQADLVLIAPGTANTMAKIAAGIADNLLNASVLVATCPVMIAPAMHTEMWNNAATQANVKTLAERGVEFIGPASGRLTGADSGVGRMVEPEEIAGAVLTRLGLNDCRGAGELEGTSLVISAGGTREPIDPVRFIGNHSTGRMGIELANQAARRGASVSLVAANIESAMLAQVDSRVVIVPVSSALELSEAMEARADADVLIMAAAVADYRVAERSATKIKHGDSLELSLIANPDILAGLVRNRRPNQIIVGFAAETGDDTNDYLEFGRQKARKKGADLLVINRVGERAGFGDVDTAVTIVDASGATVGEAAGTKREVAAAIMSTIPSRKNL
ncbi:MULTISPECIES: bifunctional phosphopantothenoylcysteine decarboxylase/phosphopantothenate--cysteine ligase CoaBC [Trueperella]|uniref:bifunctional phosphopantothenoylcysteine decarboxylase/phosphopantothenate--cysteine ligase CoaBC n=1 Tax=Trueperella TaxID=1069494 RepID=UPI001FEEFCBF|nr:MULTISPECIES: bifunctional phosphopantothenoylcysteine decarboxylase/phosphopantothenate--cysteine ligase CoaBC [Trueperella]MCM3906586.1 bifunctional phosphopantothenoylcysteine decarboxylase/phosphopantothenate--cysteine ligase CoaBC [Trueperella bernardiae]WIM08759.1 bifunctional phosphopantothenoylcysteine decarboxylase/phosphopantothenate--cysteine ligase CoaBC [Trueperella bernardiae]